MCRFVRDPELVPLEPWYAPTLDLPRAACQPQNHLTSRALTDIDRVFGVDFAARKRHQSISIRSDSDLVGIRQPGGDPRCLEPLRRLKARNR